MLWFEQTKTIVFDPPKTGTMARRRRYIHLTQHPKSVEHVGHITPTIRIHDRPSQVMEQHDISNHMKIVCVRNPWRRVASMYRMMYSRGVDMRSESLRDCATLAARFERFVFGHCRWYQDPYLEYHDHLLQMEQWDQLTAFIDTRVDTPMDSTPSTYKPDPYFDRVFKHWYTQQMIDHVAEHDKQTIKMLGYEFE